MARSIEERRSTDDALWPRRARGGAQINLARGGWLPPPEQWKQFEWNAREPLARKAGLKPDTITAIRDERRPQQMSAQEEALYELCTERHRSKSVSDPTYERAVQALGCFFARQSREVSSRALTGPPRTRLRTRTAVRGQDAALTST
jgi:hypothetical protein